MLARRAEVFQRAVEGVGEALRRRAEVIEGGTRFGHRFARGRDRDTRVVEGIGEVVQQRTGVFNRVAQGFVRRLRLCREGARGRSEPL